MVGLGQMKFPMILARSSGTRWGRLWGSCSTPPARHRPQPTTQRGSSPPVRAWDSSGSQNTNIRAYKPQLLVWLRFNKINNLNYFLFIFFVTNQSRKWLEKSQIEAVEWRGEALQGLPSALWLVTWTDAAAVIGPYMMHIHLNCNFPQFPSNHRTDKHSPIGSPYIWGRVVDSKVV